MSGHHRRGSSRAALPRRSTKGPLEGDDPLASSVSPPSSPAPTSLPLLDASTEMDVSITEPLAKSQTTVAAATSAPLEKEGKDLSFLLDSSIYHPLSNIEAPPPHRYPFPPPPPANTPLSRILSQLANLLAQCRFLPAAHLAATTLVSGLIASTDSASIFHLLSIRYSALELSGNVVLAAQEAKALEDLSSTFYYHGTAGSDADHSILDHIMPFDLRLQALRLQGIGFGDSRKTIGALFDLGMECREVIANGTLKSEESQLWTDRLDEVGVRVVNSLIELGDLDCAKRTLDSMKPRQSNDDTEWLSRMILLLVKMGEVKKAQQMLMARKTTAAEEPVLWSLIFVAEGRFEDAADLLSRASDGDTANPNTIAIAKQNLAVAYLYMGEIQKSQRILEELVSQGHSFQTLTINLATLYDLSSDKSKDLKTKLSSRVAEASAHHPQRAFINADFKL